MGKIDRVKATVTDLQVLAGLRAERDTLELAKTQEIQRILTEEQREQIIDIENVYRLRKGDLAVSIKELEDKIKDAVILVGKTIKGSLLQVVWNKGRVTWKAKDLEEFLEDNPELVKQYPDILKCRKQGDSFGAIRKV
jgi:hypothetical protein